MVRAKLASYASRALDPGASRRRRPCAQTRWKARRRRARDACAPHAETRNGAREGARREARARRGRVSADASARDAPKVAEALDMSCGSRDDAARSSTRRVRAMEPKWRRRERRSDPKPRRDERRVCSAAVRRFRVTKRRSRGGRRRLARTRSGADREAPRARGVFPWGKRQLALGPTKTQENGRTPPRRLKSYLARSSGSRGAPRAIFCFLAAAFLSFSGEAVRGAPRGAKRAPREEDLARREPWVSWYVPRPRDRPTRVSPRPNPRGRAARPRENTRPATR